MESSDHMAAESKSRCPVKTDQVEIIQHRSSRARIHGPYSVYTP